MNSSQRRIRKYLWHGHLGVLVKKMDTELDYLINSQNVVYLSNVYNENNTTFVI